MKQHQLNDRIDNQRKEIKRQLECNKALRIKLRDQDLIMVAMICIIFALLIFVFNK